MTGHPFGTIQRPRRLDVMRRIWTEPCLSFRHGRAPYCFTSSSEETAPACGSSCRIVFKTWPPRSRKEASLRCGSCPEYCGRGGWSRLTCTMGSDGPPGAAVGCTRYRILENGDVSRIRSINATHSRRRNEPHLKVRSRSGEMCGFRRKKRRSGPKNVLRPRASIS